MALVRPTVRTQKGLTLVEIAVVLAILAILAVMAVQLGGHWTNSAKLTQTQASLQHAFSAAKSVALQNNLAVTGDEPSASLCVEGHRVAVVLGDSCASTAVWSATSAASITTKLGDTTGPACVSFNSAGVPVATDDCTSATEYSLTAGTAYAQDKKLY